MPSAGNEHPDRLPFLLLSDEKGNIFEHHRLKMCAAHLNGIAVPDTENLIRLPAGSNLFMLPGRHPLAYNPDREKFEEVTEYQGKEVFAVSAFMAPAHLQYHYSAYKSCDAAPRLPLYGYTAVGWLDDTFWVNGRRIDPDPRQDLDRIDHRMIKKRARTMLRRNRHNRLTVHLIKHCVFEYGCPAARNFVLRRFEAPLPTSPACNARCLGCISQQPAESCVESSQRRIAFVPNAWEVAETAVSHLEAVPDGVVSFGQGCEGEPLLQARLLEASIRKIRESIDTGTINLNTNAFDPDAVQRLCKAGLDSIRISMNSVRKPYYEAYYRPANYRFEDVVQSIETAKRCGIWVSLNYLIFPGFTDRYEEVRALEQLIESCGIDMIQTRNLNIDPEWYAEEVVLPAGRSSGEYSGESLGIKNWLGFLSQRFPDLSFGYFNPAEEFITSRQRQRKTP